MVLVVPAMIYQVAQLGETIFQQIPQIVDKVIAALHPLEEKLHAAKIEVKAMDILSTFAANMPRLIQLRFLRAFRTWHFRP